MIWLFSTERDKEGLNLDEWGVRRGMRCDKGGETIIRIYPMKNIQIIKNKQKFWFCDIWYKDWKWTSKFPAITDGYLWSQMKQTIELFKTM